MSSINRHYTFEYSQPEEYHFSHDSVFMARRVFEIYRDAGPFPMSGLDLCAGCGIIGLDFLFHCQKELPSVPVKFDFLEVQEVYQKHFTENVHRANIEQTQLSFLNKNYSILGEIAFQNKYDLILCNPPFFYPGQGKLSPSEFKNRCRFFIDSDLKTLIQSIENCLTANGNAFVLLRDQPEHGWSAPAEVLKLLSSSFQMQILKDIRGTDLVRLNRKS